MDRILEVHTLLHRKDIPLYIKTYTLFNHYFEEEFIPVIHEDGSFTSLDVENLKELIPNIEVILREDADTKVKLLLQNFELCDHFRFAEHHTIFRIKLFDPFLLSTSKNVLYLDSDVLFCKKPYALLENIDKRVGCYLRDSWSAYCVPFRDEDNDTTIDRFINAGLTYFPTQDHFSLPYIEECLSILYQHGSRGATHPFLEQNCIAYLITQQKKTSNTFVQLPHPDYCVPTFGEFTPNHNLTALHLNSSPLVGRYRENYYSHEVSKLECSNIQ